MERYDSNLDFISDEDLFCVTCGSKFTFTAGEHRFYLSKGLIIPPRHCPECRRRRRMTINTEGKQTTTINNVLTAPQKESYR